MKKKYIYSSLLGGGFFAASYLLLSLGIVPSLLTSVVAFGAGSLIFKDNYNLNNLGIDNLENYKMLLNESNMNKILVESFQRHQLTLRQ